MELRHLRTFLTVAETLNISEAARRLRVTQPALSRQIHELEHAIGHPLFVRHPGGLRLTSTGVTLRDEGAKALAGIDDAVQKARGAAVKEPSMLRVGYYGSIGIWSSILAPALKKLDRKFPSITYHVVELSCGQLAAELREGKLDAAVLGPGTYGGMSGIVLETACTVPAMAMVPVNHRLAKKRTISLEELRDEEIVSVTAASWPGRDRAFIAACEAQGFSPKISRVASNLPDAIVAITKRMGVGIIGVFASLAPHPGVAFIKLKPPGVPLEIYAAYSKTSMAARQLGALIVAEGQRAARNV